MIILYLINNNTITKLNSFGLNAYKFKEWSADLNWLLPNFQIYYQNLRGIRWYFKGKRFFDLRLKFEELFNDANLKVDMIAERILTLGGIPQHTFKDYIAHSKVPFSR